MGSAATDRVEDMEALSGRFVPAAEPFRVRLREVKLWDG